MSTPDNAVDNGDCTPPLVTELWAVHDLMDDRGMCPYYRRGEPGQDPEGICSFGCRDEPSCMTDHGGPEFPWASEAMRDLIARVEQVGWWERHHGGLVVLSDVEWSNTDAHLFDAVYRLTAPTAKRPPASSSGG